MNAGSNDRWRRRSWIAASAGFAVCGATLFFDWARVFQAYWSAWIFWAGVSFGAIVLLMLHTLTGGVWGDAVRTSAEAVAMTVPLVALLFIPALFGLGAIFPWMHASAFAGHEWPHQHAYLTAPWFVVRGLFYLLSLSVLTAMLGLWRRPGTFRAPFPVSPRNAAAVSSGGLIGYFGLMLFASTDWVVSLEPQWTSTMFVVIFATGHFLAALSLAVIVSTSRSESAPPVSARQLHDLGNLLLAFVIFWAYVTFSQFLLVWSGNLPREISWYLHRSAGGWPHVTVALVVVQFAGPFVLLLSRSAKQHRRVLRSVAMLVFAANAVHVWWLVAPSFQPTGVRIPFLESAAFVGIGGVWMALFLRFLRERQALEWEVAHA